MRRNPLQRRTVLASIGIGALCAGGIPLRALARAKPAAVSSRLSEFFGKEAVALLQAATAIEIARLRKNPTGAEGYVVERVDRLNGAMGNAFRDLFLSAGTYDLPAIGEADAKLCGAFIPGAVVRFQRAPGKLVDVLISFSCNEAGMAMGAALPKKLAKGAAYEGWPRFRADISPGGVRVLELVLRVYPKDSDLKAFLAVQKGE